MKIRILSILCFLTLFKLVMAAEPIILYKDANAPQLALKADDIGSKIRQDVKQLLAKHPDTYKAIVSRYSGFVMVRLLSSKYWSVQSFRINTNTQNNPSVTAKLVPQEKQSLEESTDMPAHCPDPDIQFVSISAYPDVGHVTEDTTKVYEFMKRKYRSKLILGDDATAQNYKNWLSCPNLVGFYSIGHGNNKNIYVANGERVNYKFFLAPSLNKLYRNTTIAINSCEAFNFPFGGAIMFGDNETIDDYEHNSGPNAKFYMSGYTDLPIGSSEDTSACFMISVMNGDKFDQQTLRNCATQYEFFARSFGIYRNQAWFE